MSITLDKHKPVPLTKGRPGRYPWKSMEVGDSFWAASTPNNLLVCAHGWSHRNNQQWQFRTKAEERDGIDGTRIWRSA